MMEILKFFCICLIGLTIAQALPTQFSEEEGPAAAVNSSNYASVASQIIAINLLKSYMHIDENQVYSPLGAAVELALLAEATNGETYEEFNKVFGYPKKRTSLRASYKRLLAQYQKRDDASEPILKTWLYVYYNYSAREKFKQLIKEHYFVEVKNINRVFYDWPKQNTSLDNDIEPETTTTLSNSKDVIGIETLKHLNIDADAADEVAAAKALKDDYGEEIFHKEASKFERDVECKQSEEKPVFIDEIKNEAEKVDKRAEPLDEAVLQKRKHYLSEEAENQELKELKNREEQLNGEENETVSEDEKAYKNYNERISDKIIVPSHDGLASNEPNKVSSSLQKLENVMQMATKEEYEIMIALESQLCSVRRVSGARTLFNKNDITSGVSGNFIRGREIGSKKKMLLLNGLYFRGNWANGFHELKDAGEQFFFMTATHSIETTMMHASGSYNTANLERLNAKALCIPYVNKKYNLLLIVPNEVEGLHSLIEKIQPSHIIAMCSLSQEKHLKVILPKFHVAKSSHSESMLKNLGLRKLFSREEADLSLLTDDPDVRVNGISQFIKIYVDEGGNSNDALSSATTQARTTESSDLENFEVIRPFLYFVMDCEKELVIVSGKIYEPEYYYEEPLNIEVEFRELIYPF